MKMEISFKKKQRSLILTPVSNINLLNKSVIDPSLLDELPIDESDKLCVFNLLTQVIEHVDINKLNTKHHWHYIDGELFMVIHIL